MAFACTVYADEPTSFDLISSNSGVKTGEQFAVTVTGRNVKDLDAYQVNLTFDADRLDLVKAVSNIEGYTVPARVNGSQVTMANAKIGNAATAGSLRKVRRQEPRRPRLFTGCLSL